MERTIETQSLLPWLDPGSSKIYLDVSLQIKSLTGQGKLDSPFRLLDSSSPLFHLIHASYRTPSGKPVKEVFLLIQKDHYSFTEKSVPFNNAEIDKIWQDAFNFSGLDDGLGSYDSLVDSSAHQASFPLWQSLFYCEKHNSYFHPPCPQCGNQLELCHHDEILSTAGLPSYTTTLERFLFCPLCHADQSKSNFFYNDKGNTDHPLVKNRRDLIDGIEQLVKNMVAGENFPCNTCNEQSDCYKSDRAIHRISPFAFYPFRMIVIDAASLPAQDFVSMLSGASCTEIKKQSNVVREAGVSACLQKLQEQETEGIKLFFQNDKRCFLELLFLKIALLDQVVRTVFVAQKHLKHPDLRLSIDQFWVDFPDLQGMLPSFWNFKVRPVALGIHPSDDSTFVKVPESFSLYSLALLWFNTLLINRGQSAADVQHALAGLFEKEDGIKCDPDCFPASVNDAGLFGAGNIFWDPAENEFPPSWLNLWQKALGLGWILLQASFQLSKFSEDVFAGEVGQLAKDLKKTMFASNNELIEVQRIHDYDNEILEILLNLQEKWKEKTEPASLEPDLEETVILNIEQIASLMEKKGEEGSEGVAEKLYNTTVKKDPEVDEDLGETVIMNVNDFGSILPDDHTSGVEVEKKSTEAQPPQVADDDLSETVIISLEELEKLKKGKNGPK